MDTYFGSWDIYWGPEGLCVATIEGNLFAHCCLDCISQRFCDGGLEQKEVKVRLSTGRRDELH